MKHIRVPFLSVDNDVTIDDLSLKLDVGPRNGIETIPWLLYSYKPEVFFAVGYCDSCVCLKFYVSEKFARAIYSNPNEPVYKDSCVEFFISFEDEEEYYNFEFNCAGTCLLGFGKERADRKLLSKEIISLIGHQALLKPARSPDANIGWELTIKIPFKVFYYHNINTLAGKRCRVNFFKCGDELPEPHFLVWNNIKTNQPDFHVPAFFGSMEFS